MENAIWDLRKGAKFEQDDQHLPPLRVGGTCKLKRELSLLVC